MYEKRFLTLLVVLAISFLSYVYFIKHSAHFAINFLAICILLLLSIIAFLGIGINAKWGWGMFTLLFTLSLSYLLYIFYNGVFFRFTMPRLLYFVVVVLNISGFLVSALSKQEEEFDFDDEDFDEEETKETKESQKVEIVEDFSPGKFVGSKTGSNYHIPKCDWAKKIRKANQVWFNSESEAKRKGYKAHNCI